MTHRRRLALHPRQRHDCLTLYRLMPLDGNAVCLLRRVSCEFDCQSRGAPRYVGGGLRCCQPTVVLSAVCETPGGERGRNLFIRRALYLEIVH